MEVAIVWEFFHDDGEGSTRLEDDPSGSTAKNRWSEKHLKPKLANGIMMTLSSELHYDIKFTK